MRAVDFFKENTYTLNEFYNYLALLEDGLSGDVEVEVVSERIEDASKAVLDADGMVVDVEVELQNSEGEVHRWFNGTLAATVATADDGEVEDENGDPWSSLKFENGKATMRLYLLKAADGAAWTNDETVTVTIGSTDEISLSGDLVTVAIVLDVEGA